MARQMTPETVAIRTLLDNNADLTHSQAVPLLAEQKMEVDAAKFNAVKMGWKASKQKAKQEKAARKAEKKAAISDEEALVFVRDAGGVTAAREKINRQLALIGHFESNIARLAV